MIVNIPLLNHFISSQNSSQKRRYIKVLKRPASDTGCLVPRRLFVKNSDAHMTSLHEVL
jgi:hypothetical protein